MGNWPKYRQNVKLHTYIAKLRNTGKYDIDTGLPCSFFIQVFALSLTSVDTRQKKKFTSHTHTEVKS